MAQSSTATRSSSFVSEREQKKCNDSVKSGESNFKIYTFTPSLKEQNAQKCIDFWEFMEKESGLKPVKGFKLGEEDIEQAAEEEAADNPRWRDILGMLKQRGLHKLALNNKLKECSFCAIEKGYVMDGDDEVFNLEELNDWDPFRKYFEHVEVMTDPIITEDKCIMTDFPDPAVILAREMKDLEWEIELRFRELAAAYQIPECECTDCGHGGEDDDVSYSSYRVDRGTCTCGYEECLCGNYVRVAEEVRRANEALERLDGFEVEKCDCSDVCCTCLKDYELLLEAKVEAQRAVDAKLGLEEFKCTCGQDNCPCQIVLRLSQEIDRIFMTPTQDDISYASLPKAEELPCSCKHHYRQVLERKLKAKMETTTCTCVQDLKLDPIATCEEEEVCICKEDNKDDLLEIRIIKCPPKAEAQTPCLSPALSAADLQRKSESKEAASLKLENACWLEAEQQEEESSLSSKATSKPSVVPPPAPKLQIDPDKCICTVDVDCGCKPEKNTQQLECGTTKLGPAELKTCKAEEDYVCPECVKTRVAEYIKERMTCNESTCKTQEERGEDIKDRLAQPCVEPEIHSYICTECTKQAINKSLEHEEDICSRCHPEEAPPEDNPEAECACGFTYTCGCRPMGRVVSEVRLAAVTTYEPVYPTKPPCHSKAKKGICLSSLPPILKKKDSAESTNKQKKSCSFHVTDAPESKCPVILVSPKISEYDLRIGNIDRTPVKDDCECPSAESCTKVPTRDFCTTKVPKIKGKKSCTPPKAQKHTVKLGKATKSATVLTPYKQLKGVGKVTPSYENTDSTCGIPRKYTTFQMNQSSRECMYADNAL